MYYKWVCWRCRLTWYPRARKWKPTEDCPLHSRTRPDKCCSRCWTEDENACTGSPRCRHCSQPAAEVNPDFRPPKKKDDKGWAISERLFRADANYNPHLPCSNRNSICEYDLWFLGQNHTVWDKWDKQCNMSPVQREVVDAVRLKDQKSLDRLWFRGVYTDKEDYMKNLQVLLRCAAPSRK